MPVLSIITNQPVDDGLRPAMLKALSQSVATALGKPESYVMVQYQYNPAMLFAGNQAPLAYLELKSIGLPGERTSALSATLTDAVQQHLGLAADRVYIEFADAQRHMFGWDGRTFA